jgi:hypothetical protein
MRHHGKQRNDMQKQKESLLPSLMLALKRLRGFGSSFVVFHLFETGIYDELVKGPTAIDILTSSLKLQENFVRSILDYCTLDGLVLRDGINYTLTEEGKSLYLTKGWAARFEMECFLSGMVSMSEWVAVKLANMGPFRCCGNSSILWVLRKD